MSIGGAISSAVLGLAANARSIEIAADNLANVSTPGYGPKEVVATTVVTRAPSAAGYSAGGLRTSVRSKVSFSTPSFEISNVNVGDEYARLIQARAAYRANADVITTASGMLKEPIFA